MSEHSNYITPMSYVKTEYSVFCDQVEHVEEVDNIIIHTLGMGITS